MSTPINLGIATLLVAIVSGIYFPLATYRDWPPFEEMAPTLTPTPTSTPVPTPTSTPTPEPPPTAILKPSSLIEIIANPSIIETNGEVLLTLVLSGRQMLHPITFVWSRDSGDWCRDPGCTPLDGATQVREAIWVAPNFPTVAEIRVVAVDTTGHRISGKTIIQVVKSSQSEKDTGRLTP